MIEVLAATHKAKIEMDKEVVRQDSPRRINRFMWCLLADQSRFARTFGPTSKDAEPCLGSFINEVS